MDSPPDGNAVRTLRTRARILGASLALFNERGEARVGTGAIAAELGMSPGNLYYHFRNKERIVAELAAQFEARIAVELREDAAGEDAIEDLWLYLHLMLEAIRDYRFLYRGPDELLARSPALRQAFQRIGQRKLATLVALCDRLVAARAMKAEPEEIRTLARNVLLVATCWLQFSALAGTRGPADADLGLAAHQVMSLIAPYLRGRARTHLDRLSRRYID
jgi:AcrR family transcriptional regulator